MSVYLSYWCSLHQTLPLVFLSIIYNIMFLLYYVSMYQYVNFVDYSPCGRAGDTDLSSYVKAVGGAYAKKGAWPWMTGIYLGSAGVRSTAEKLQRVSIKRCSLFTCTGVSDSTWMSQCCQPREPKIPDLSINLHSTRAQVEFTYSRKYYYIFFSTVCFVAGH